MPPVSWIDSQTTCPFNVGLVLFIDLIKKYDDILPPTISRKKRESERKLPIRKRTAPVDMRMSRSRISDVPLEVQQQLLAQQKGLKSPEIPVPPLPSLDPAPAPSHVAFVPPPPPPPLDKNPIVPPPPIPSAEPETRKPPVFKEPPPENDDLPPRPQFKEPPPELDDDAAPPMPKFAEPPAEVSEIPSTGVVAPTPKPAEPSTKVTSRSPSPTPSESRKGVGIARGPRITRGPRTQGGSVQSLVSNINRTSISATGPSSPRSGSPNPTYKRLSGSASPTAPGHNRRPSSVLGRSAAFSRRTMASDAEDDVDKK